MKVARTVRVKDSLPYYFHIFRVRPNAFARNVFSAALLVIAVSLVADAE